mmetsp:Transcript_5717/g.17016  ORF Transcript_5717/g.17016 Transcript_5717/m.17016 type:complete len:551 (+) Transcript_5717:273-1925(+)
MSGRVDVENGDDFGENGEDFEGDSEESPVRQDSSYSKLSADSWLKVESEYDGDDDPAEEELRGQDTGDGDFYFWIDIALRLREKNPSQRSVLECVVELLSGTGASKKRKYFMGFGDKRVWFSPDVRSIKWTSKRKGAGHGILELSQVRAVRASGHKRSILIETTEKKRIALSMPNSQDLELWIRCLACFSSFQATISCHDVAYRAKEREDYDLSCDTWEKKQLRKLVQVDDYYILDTEDVPASRAMLALCRADRHFHGLKQLPSTVASQLQPEELAVLKKLNHPNVLKFKEFLKCKDREGFYAIFEYIPRGVVIGGYKLENNKPIPEDTAKRLINDVASGLMYLHSHRIAHGDIRPDNLLLAADGTLKINPLGAIFYDHSNRRKSISFSGNLNSPNAFAFTAPERCREATKVQKPLADDYDTDTWSLGALLYFMVYGRAPFLGATAKEMQEQITTAKLSFPESPRVSKRTRDLIRKILGEKDPRRRMKLEDVMRHPWLADSNGPVSSFSFNPMRLFGKTDMERRKVHVSPGEVQSALTVGTYHDPSTDEY